MKDGKTTQPWQDSDGKILSSMEIKKVCKTWGPETWERYLNSVVEVELEETLFNKGDGSEYVPEDCFTKFLEQAELPKYKAALKKSIQELTVKQQRVIFLVFWRNYSLSEVASCLGVTKATAQGLKARALQKLGKNIMDTFIKPTPEDDLWTLEEPLPTYESIRNSL